MGTVELCVIHGGGANVPPVLDATFKQHDYGMYVGQQKRLLSMLLHSLITIGGDIIFNASTVFTLASGEKICFNVTIVDDDEIEYVESYFFELDDSLFYYHFYDYTQIVIRDNEGQKLYKVYTIYTET